MDLTYQRGKFNKLYAKMPVRIGGQHNITVGVGDEIEYDGMVLKYAGMDVSLGPSLRSSIRQGWFTDDPDDVNSGVSAVIPSRNIAKSQTKNTDLARVQRHDGAPIQTDNMDENTVMNVSDRRPNAQPDKNHPGGRNVRAEPRAIKKGWKSGGLVINPGVIEEQDYTPVAKLRTAANVGKIDMYKSESSELSARLSNLSGSGAIPIHQRQHEETIEREGITIRTTGKMNRNAPIEIAQEGDGKIVGKVRHSSRGSGNAEGIEVRDTSNIRADRVAAKAVEPKPIKIDMKLPPKIRMARRIDPSFPTDWSFSGKLADRLIAVKKHGATPQFLEALYAAEGDQMRKALSNAYPKQFSD